MSRARTCSQKAHCSGRRLYRVGRRLFARPLTGPGNVRHSVVPADATIVAGTAVGGSLTVAPFDVEDLHTPTLAMLGCDPAAGLLEPELRRRGIRLAAAEESSSQALLGLARGEAHVAGCHLFDQATGGFNRSWVRRLVPFPCTLVTFASWQQGLMVTPGNPQVNRRNRKAWGRPGVSMVNRQAGSGSRALAGPGTGQSGSPRRRCCWLSTRGVGAPGGRGGHRLRRGRRRGRGQGRRGGFRLGFHPLEDERYDLVIPDHMLNEMPVQALLDILRQDPVRRRVESLGGYDTSQRGLPAAA